MIGGLLVTALSAAAVAAPGAPYDPAAVAAVESMEHAAEGLKSYTMVLVRRELFGKTMDPEEKLAVKWRRPQQIYFRVIEGPAEGQEVLFATGWNKNRLKVHKGINFNLDPYGNLAMRHAHHPVPEVSLVQFVAVVADNLRRARAKNVGTLSAAARETLWQRPALRLEASMPPTGKTPTLTNGQTLWDVAKASGQSMYVILHANRARKWWQADHPEPGDAVIVPDFYAGRMVLWVDEELHLPLQADLFDHDGNLYEHYEHRELKVNVPLTDEDFSPKNPAYGF